MTGAAPARLIAELLDESRARRALAGLRPAGGDVRADCAAAVWSVLTEPGDGIAGHMLQTLGAPAALEALGRAPETLATDVGIPAAELRTAFGRWLPRLETAAIDRAFALARRAGVRLVTPDDDAWPARLDDLGAHRPHVLWVRGDPMHLAPTTSVAVVGARASTGYGDAVAAELAGGLASEGIVVVSGAAYGIDGVAHRAALGVGGPTIALLAGGLDRPYPAGHTDLIARIAERGAVVGETPCGTVPSKWRFLARNRIIAALSDATIVVEAGLRSGSLNTAAHAAAIGRPLGAVPGSVASAASAGCHRILREYDGVCITGVDEARELLGLGSGPRAEVGGRTDDLTRVLDAASSRVGRTAAELARRAGLTQPETEALLGIAELSGEVERAGDGWRRASRR